MFWNSKYKKAIVALKKIAYPLQYMGIKNNAFRLSNDPYHLKNIAKKCLEDLGEQDV